MIASQIITDIQVNSKSEIMLHVGYYHMGEGGIYLREGGLSIERPPEHIRVQFAIRGYKLKLKL